MPITKDQALSISLSGIVSLAGVLGVVWVVVRPLLIASISTAMAQETKEVVKSEVAPLVSGFQVLLSQQVSALRRQIAELERLRAAAPQSWTSEQARALVDAQEQLAAQIMALQALQ